MKTVIIIELILVGDWDSVDQSTLTQVSKSVTDSRQNAAIELA